MNQDPIIQTIIELLDKQGKSQKNLTDYLGITQNAFTDWKSGRIKSYRKHLSKIAEFLNVSVDYLLGKEQEKKTPSKVLSPSFSLTPRETAVLIAYRTHPSEQPAVDKLLDVPTTPEEITLYVAAYSEGNTPDSLTTVSKSEWEKLKAIPTTTQKLD